tara:strand:- start:271 stop:411 length:141 start_codon:yes stop_codon:yes gene_type:complete
MDTNTILNTVTTFGYAVGILGIAVCLGVYFALPKVIKLLLGNKEEK